MLSLDNLAMDAQERSVSGTEVQVRCIAVAHFAK
jgi:hypothetical protein